LALIDNPEAVRLAKALYDVYEAQRITRRNENICDICGRATDHARKGIFPRKVFDGFLHRPDQAPSLCMAHLIGWTKTIGHVREQRYLADITDSYDADIDDDNVDLIFATYLAKQLLKQSNIVKESKWN
jgi:hypothetical protein